MQRQILTVTLTLTLTLTNENLTQNTYFLLFMVLNACVGIGY